MRAGDEQAFDQLYQRYVPRLYDFGVRLLRDPGAAEDLVQSTFIRAYEHRDALRDAAKVKSWLFTIAHNLAMDQVEGRRPTEPVEDRWDLAAPEPGPEAEAEAREAGELVWAAAAGLEPRQYAVLDMSVRQQLTTAEIAEVLGLPRVHAAVLVNRAREALGNAVRFLMVARRRDHCERLAELVPAGLRALSAEQRSTVDYHMRHCEVCQVMARRLTTPAELFGELAPVPTPTMLRQPPPASLGGVHASGPRPQRMLSRALSAHSRLALGGAVVATATAVVVAVAVLASHHSGPTASARPSPSPEVLSLARLLSQPFAAAVLAGIPSGSSSSFIDAACPSSTVCYAVGGSPAGGIVAATRDGARTWSTSTIAGTSELDALACSGPARCWAAGRGSGPDGVGIILATSDGRTWSRQLSRAGLIVGSMACPAPGDCIAVGANLAQGTRDAVATTDGGATWVSRALPDPTASAWAVRCYDVMHCIAVGTGAWETADLGATWIGGSPSPSTPLPGQSYGGQVFLLNDATYASPTDIWVVGGLQCGGETATQCPAFVFHSTDGGNSWTPNDQAQQTFPYGWQIHCQGSACLMVAQAFTTSSIVVAADGTTWKMTQTVDGQLNALACSSGGFCIVAGGNTTGADLLVARQP